MDAHLDSRNRHASVPRPEPLAIDQGELRSLLSSLSHELCRPLVSLRAGFDLLLGDASGSVSPEQKGHLLTMVSLCDDLLRLTRGYLDYAALVEGCRSPSLGTFSLGAIVREIDRQFGPTARARGLGWSTLAHEPDAQVVTDASLCQQIFANLVSNALKYTPAGGKVRVEGKAGREEWCVSVIDDGPGIPAESLERVFEPFYRLARDEHSRIEGNGLGLSICRELIERLGGRIDLDSSPGVGTTVQVRLPRTPASSTPTAPPPATARRPTRRTRRTAEGPSRAG